MLILRINGWPQLAADCVGGSRGAPLAPPAFGLAWLAGGSPTRRRPISGRVSARSATL